MCDNFVKGCMTAQKIQHRLLNLFFLRNHYTWTIFILEPLRIENSGLAKHHNLFKSLSDQILWRGANISQCSLRLSNLIIKNMLFKMAVQPCTPRKMYPKTKRVLAYVFQVVHDFSPSTVAVFVGFIRRYFIKLLVSGPVLVKDYPQVLCPATLNLFSNNIDNTCFCCWTLEFGEIKLNPSYAGSFKYFFFKAKQSFSNLRHGWSVRHRHSNLAFPGDDFLPQK